MENSIDQYNQLNNNLKGLPNIHKIKNQTKYNFEEEGSISSSVESVSQLKRQSIGKYLIIYGKYKNKLINIFIC